MREILFRGKRCDNGEWVQGSIWLDDVEIENCEMASISWWSNDKTVWNRENVTLATVGQFTEMTDKNGKKIFEGDIVRVCLDPEICVGKVIWDSKIASYNIPFNNGKCVLPLDIFIAKNKVGDKAWIEVIGNIHDNPELLENP